MDGVHGKYWILFSHILKTESKAAQTFNEEFRVLFLDTHAYIYTNIKPINTSFNTMQHSHVLHVTRRSHKSIRSKPQIITTTDSIINNHWRELREGRSEAGEKEDGRSGSVKGVARVEEAEGVLSFTTLSSRSLELPSIHLRLSLRTGTQRYEW